MSYGMDDLVEFRLVSGDTLLLTVHSCHTLHVGAAVFVRQARYKVASMEFEVIADGSLPRVCQRVWLEVADVP